jgi:hypothetical protein
LPPALVRRVVCLWLSSSDVLPFPTLPVVPFARFSGQKLKAYLGTFNSVRETGRRPRTTDITPPILTIDGALPVCAVVIRVSKPGRLTSVVACLARSLGNRSLFKGPLLRLLNRVRPYFCEIACEIAYRSTINDREQREHISCLEISE